jgi:hypothetical protein
LGRHQFFYLLLKLPPLFFIDLFLQLIKRDLVATA